MKDFSEHFFRHEYGRLVAGLCRRFGAHRLEAIEDAVQFALSAALQTWTSAGAPDNPAAWLHRVAHHRLLEEVRRDARRAELVAGAEPGASAPEPWTGLEADVRDELLRMLFACCDPELPAESQLVVALKLLCGFDVAEIAERLFLSEANVYKRLSRGRAQLRDAGFAELTPAHLVARLPSVQSVLYVLFTEGYLSSHPEGAIRRELCDEAIRLGTELASHPIGARPDSFALLALMHLHTARLTARQDASGGLLLLEEQDRALWDQRQVELGLHWLARSAEGDAFSRYHAEAGVAAEHALSPTFAATRWDRVVACYELLENVSPSPLHTLNRALALAEWRGAAAGLAVLEGLAPPSWLEGSHLWSAVFADLYRRCGQLERAEAHRVTALAAAPSSAVRATLERRLNHD